MFGVDNNFCLYCACNNKLGYRYVVGPLFTNKCLVLSSHLFGYCAYNNKLGNVVAPLFTNTCGVDNNFFLYCACYIKLGNVVAPMFKNKHLEKIRES